MRPTSVRRVQNVLFMAKRYENNKEGDVHDREEETQEDIYAN